MENRVSFEFYFNTFCGGRGGAVPVESFDRCARIAQRELESFLCSASDAEGFENDILLCLCELTEEVFRSEKSRGVKNETIDGYSVAFEGAENSRTELQRIIVQRLGKSGLLYAGVE